MKRPMKRPRLSDPDGELDGLSPHTTGTRPLGETAPGWMMFHLNRECATCHHLGWSHDNGDECAECGCERWVAR